MRAGVALKGCISFWWEVLRNRVTENTATRISLSGMPWMKGLFGMGGK